MLFANLKIRTRLWVSKVAPSAQASNVAALPKRAIRTVAELNAPRKRAAGGGDAAQQGWEEF